MSNSVGFMAAAAVGLASTLLFGQPDDTKLEGLYAETQLETHGEVEYVTAPPSHSEGIFTTMGTSLTSAVNCRSVMRGASANWDAQRLIDGKFKLYKEIGAEEVGLETSTNDEIHGMYFDTSKFQDKVKEMAGSLKLLRSISTTHFSRLEKKLVLKMKRQIVTVLQ
jgi:hypothetical protein